MRCAFVPLSAFLTFVEGMKELIAGCVIRGGQITGAITRRDAMMRVISLSDGDDMPLDEGLSVFSGFWGIEYDEVRPFRPLLL